MRKSVASFLLIFILLILKGCSVTKDKPIIDNTQDIVKISIKTQPGEDRNLKSTEDKKHISEIINYINTLDLEKTRIDVGQYDGMSYVITVFYNNTRTEYILFGTFFMDSEGDWYEIPYKQGERFEDIYNGLD